MSGPPIRFQPSREPAHRHDVAVDASAADAEELLEAVHDEQAAGADAKNAQRVRRPSASADARRRSTADPGSRRRRRPPPDRERKNIQQDRIAAVAVRVRGRAGAGRRKTGRSTAPPAASATGRVNRPSMISSARRKRDQLDDALVRQPRGIAGFRIAEHLLHAVTERRENRKRFGRGSAGRASSTSRTAVGHGCLATCRRPSCIPPLRTPSGIISIRSVSGGINRSAQLVAGHPRLRVRLRIVDRDGELHRVHVHAVVSLLDAHLVAVRVAGVVEPRPLVRADRVDDERGVVLPPADRVAVPPRVRILGQLPAVGPDRPPPLLEHVQHQHLVRRLHDLERPQLEQQVAREPFRIAHRRQRVVDLRDRRHPDAVSGFVGLAERLSPRRERSSRGTRARRCPRRRRPRCR